MKLLFALRCPMVCATIVAIAAQLTGCAANVRLEHADISKYARLHCRIQAGKAHLTIRNTSNRTIAFVRPGLWNTEPAIFPPGIDEMMPPMKVLESMIVILKPGEKELRSIDVPRTHTGPIRYTADPTRLMPYDKPTLKGIRKMRVLLCDKGELIATQ